ncbi:uncharacterized protein [Palaemon carinicauda]|uniref:uncharacterized protein n=1 Tax=Palaemon carinicauda TaxID=392227 RepID=UPI0035B5BC6E
MASPHIMLPLDGPISLDKTVDQVLMENPDQPMVIAPLEDPLDKFQHTGPSITLSTNPDQPIFTAPLEDPLDKFQHTGPSITLSTPQHDVKYEDLTRQAYIPARFPQTMVTCPEKQITHVAPPQTLMASAEVQRFHESRFVGTEKSYKRNKPFTEKGESSVVTFKHSKPSLDVSRSISATKNIQKLQSTSAITFKATQESMGQLKAPPKSSISKLLTSKNKKESKTYTEVSSHSTSRENLNTELVTPPNVIRNLYSPKEIKDQPITPSFFPDLFNILQASEHPTSSGMITNSFIPHTTENQHTSFHSVAKDVNLNSARQGSLASSVGTTSNLIDLTQPENQAPSTSFRDLSSDIRGSPFSCGYSEAPKFQVRSPINHSELWRHLDTLTASLEEDMFGENDFETIAVDDIYEIGSKKLG